MALPYNRRRNTHDLQFGKLGYRWRASLTQVPRRLLFCSWASQWPSRPRKRRAWQRCTRSPSGPRWRPACTLRNCRRLRMCNRFLEVCAFQRRMTSKTDSIEVGMSCTLIAYTCSKTFWWQLTCICFFNNYKFQLLCFRTPGLSFKEWESNARLK